MINHVLVIAVAILLPAGQILFKRAGLAVQGRSLPDALWTLATLPGFYGALLLYGAATLLWIFVLSRMPLIAAYPWIAAATVAVPLVGWLFFGETAGPMFWAGFALIVVGLLLTQLESRG